MIDSLPEVLWSCIIDKSALAAESGAWPLAPATSLGTKATLRLSCKYLRSVVNRGVTSVLRHGCNYESHSLMSASFPAAEHLAYSDNQEEGVALAHCL
jgi:hypothetical protein